MKSVDHRYREVVECVARETKPDDVLMYALYVHLMGGVHECVNAAVVRAHDIYTHEFKREVLESFLLVDASPEEIQSIIRVSPEVTQAYAHLFFDTTTFVDELDRMDYAYEYNNSEFGKELKHYAVDMGKECLKIRLSRGAYAAPPTTVQDGIRATAFIMAQLVRVNPPDSSLANSALRWAQVGLKAADTPQDKDNASVEDLKMALVTREDAVDQKSSGIEPDEILH